MRRLRSWEIKTIRLGAPILREKNNSEGTLRVMAVRNGELIVSLFRDSLKEEKDDRSF